MNPATNPAPSTTDPGGGPSLATERSTAGEG